MIEKFTFDLHAPKVREKLILVKEELELRTHVVMKLLAYLLFYQPCPPCRDGFEPPPAWPVEKVLQTERGHLGVYKVQPR